MAVGFFRFNSVTNAHPCLDEISAVGSSTAIPPSNGAGTRNYLYGRFSAFSWETNCLRDNPALLLRNFPLSKKAARATFPFRVLRYWFVRHFLRIEYLRRSRPLSVCEIGIDLGQMCHFMQSVAAIPGLEVVECSSWTGVDRRIKQAGSLANFGYTEFIEEDIERSDSLFAGRFDAIILLHVLEHLYSPEAALEKIVPRMKPGSVLMGGFPSVPHCCARLRESHIRRHAASEGHVSAWSARRLRKIAAALGLEVEFLTGAFFLRSSGSFLENHSAWLRLNLAFGALFPNWPGELYWVLRKPRR